MLDAKEQVEGPLQSVFPGERPQDDANDDEMLVIGFSLTHTHTPQTVASAISDGF